MENKVFRGAIIIVVVVGQLRNKKQFTAEGEEKKMVNKKWAGTDDGKRDLRLARLFYLFIYL